MQLQKIDNLLEKLENTLAAKEAKTDFSKFVTHIFAASFTDETKPFIAGEYIEETGRFLQSSKRTFRVIPKDHFKSTSLYAHFMWKVWTAENNIEAHYFSYEGGMANYHLAKLKNFVRENKYFDFIQDLKKDTESVVKYKNLRTGAIVTLVPHGLLSFKRGIHGDIIYVDDPFQDPANKLDPVIVLKINNIFVEQIMDMPLIPNGELHGVGTPQTTRDFFFDADIMGRFKTMIKPAITSEKEKTALWKEHMNYDELCHRRTERKRSFNKEYMITPVHSDESYFSMGDLLPVINPELKNYSIFKDKFNVDDSEVVAGFDIGKKRHPACFSVFKKVGNNWIQLHNRFMDRWDYANPSGEYDFNNPTQIEYLKLAIDFFGIDTLRYDNTRGEFDGLADKGQLPLEFEPIVMNTKTQNSMAMSLDYLISRKQIELLDDQRMLSQITLVDNDLKSIANAEGHGDSFWSIALCFEGEEDGDYSVEVL